jgi:hypothetical protein
MSRVGFPTTVLEFFHSLNASNRTTVLQFTHPVKVISSRNFPWEQSAAGAWGWEPYRHLWADCLDYVGSSTSYLWPSTASYRHNLILSFLFPAFHATRHLIIGLGINNNSFLVPVLGPTVPIHINTLFFRLITNISLPSIPVLPGCVVETSSGRGDSK